MKHKNTEITFKRIKVRDYITISYENVLCVFLLSKDFYYLFLMYKPEPGNVN